MKKALLNKAKFLCLIGAIFLFSSNSFTNFEVSQSVLDEINSFKLKKPIFRTKSESEDLLNTVFERIQDSAKEVCKEHVKNIDRCQWELSVESNNQFNAYASEDNKITFYTGLVRGVYYEEELAFVVAHEIAHHIGNHIAEAKTKTVFGAVIGAIITGSTGIPTGNIILSGANMGRLSGSKRQELEADALSLEILQKSGYDLEKSRHGIIRLTRIGVSRVNSVFMDSHPSGPERVIWYDQVRDYLEDE